MKVINETFLFYLTYVLIIKIFKDKLSVFNKPDYNEGEEMEKKRQKASFNSKLNRFEEGDKSKKEDTETLAKAKMFEVLEDKDEQEKEAKYKADQIARTQEKFTKMDS